MVLYTREQLIEKLRDIEKDAYGWHINERYLALMYPISRISCTKPLVCWGRKRSQLEKKIRLTERNSCA